MISKQIGLLNFVYQVSKLLWSIFALMDETLNCKTNP